MIDQKKVNLVITEGIKAVTGCEAVKSNLAGVPIPPYPYISFTILRTETRKGTYSGSDARFMPVLQTWSLTVHGNEDDETLEKAMDARDWLEENGRVKLSDYGIIVQNIGSIQNRDSLLTVDYEYRKGFDMDLSLMNVIQDPKIEIIEKAKIEKE